MNTAKGIIIRLKNVSPATWVRLAFLVLALVNIGLQVFGIGTFDFGSETAEKIASLLAAVIAADAATVFSGFLSPSKFYLSDRLFLRS
ncbi:MAG: hypothetical protein J6A60_08045 [Clostridia bacterium]|nr:hypothetical protein [Clostridia bacterium]